MEKQNIIISTMPVTIKIMEVGGKKMTMSVFKQIPHGEFFIRQAGKALYRDSTKEEREASFLGWIKIEGSRFEPPVKYFLFSIDGTLYKWKPSRFNDYEYQINVRNNEINNAQGALKRLTVQEEIDYQLQKIEKAKNELSEYEHKRLLAIELNKEIYNYMENDKNQIYISI